MFRTLCLLLCLFGLLFACKSTRQAPPAREPFAANPGDPPFPALLVKAKGDTASFPLRLRELDVSVQVVGDLAITTLDFTFYNSLNQVLEGELVFPLGEGQTVSRFALEVAGRMREGVVIEKERGRQVFENIVRQDIDPGLLEWVGGNHFRARIFPIPARGSKRMLVAYEQSLKPTSTGRLYQLPLAFRNRVERMQVRVEVIKGSVMPDLSTNELGQLQFGTWKDSFVAEHSYHDFIPDRMLSFVLPFPSDAPQTWMEENGPQTWWFTQRALPDRPAMPRQLPERLCLLWDVSHSAAQRDLEREIQVLTQYLAQFSRGIVQVVPFHYQIQTGNTFSIRKGQAEGLAAYLRQLSCDGATDLSCLDLSRYPCDEFILSSDGWSNFGEARLEAGTQPIHVLSSSPMAHYPFLRRLATQSGGRFIALSTQSQTQAATALREAPLRLVSIGILEGAVSEIYPRPPFQQDGSLQLSGLLHSDDARLALTWAQGDQQWQDTLDMSKLQHLRNSGPISRLWAQAKLTHLQSELQPDAAAIRRLGKEYGLLTPHTSLIVLDRVEDYVRYDLAPPVELRAEFVRLKQEMKSVQEIELRQHLDQVATAFAARKSWWQTEFEIPDEPFQPDSVRNSLRDLEEESEVGSVVLEEYVVGNMDDMDARPDNDSPPPSPEAQEEAITQTDSIKLNPWNPETPYLRELKAKEPADRFAHYIQLKRQHGRSAGFYLDVADLFFQMGDRQKGLQILSNLAELERENAALLRVLGRRLMQLEKWDQALFVLKQVQELRPEEPQSLRDVAQVHARMGQYQSAVDLLYEVVKTPWSERFPEIGALVAQELNALIGSCECKLKLKQIDPRLRADLPTDMRVVLDWDTDAVDMDLWVIDPRGEKCYYQNRETGIGGWMSRDFTGGYGPEEFLLKSALPGTYRVQVNYYGSNQRRLVGPTHVQAQLILNYGRPTQRRQEITLRLGTKSEVLTVGELVMD